MPELPEVEALAGVPHASARSGGSSLGSTWPRSAVLKTYDPPVTALAGLTDHRRRAARQVPRPRRRRRCTWSCTWPGPAGCAGRSSCPPAPPQPGQEPARRCGVHLDDGSGLRPHRGRAPRSGSRSTSSATRATCPASPGSARTRSTRPSPRRRSAALLGRHARAQIKGVLRDQSVIAGHRQRLLRRDPARGQDVAVQAGGEAVRRTRCDRAARGDRRARCATRSTARAGLAAGDAQGARRSPGCGCTAAPGCRARSAATRCARCRSPTPSLQYCPTCQTGGKPLADRRLSRLLK